MTPEGRVELAADRLMATLSYTSVHFSQRRASGQSEGIADRKYYADYRREGRAHRHTFWFEAKAPGKEKNQSEDQRKFQRMVEHAGEDYVLGGISELVTYLNGLGIHVRELPSGGIEYDPRQSRREQRGPTSLIGESP
jgi:hypothetical protein